MNTGPTGLKIPKWPITEAEFRAFVTSINDILEFMNRQAKVSFENQAPTSSIGGLSDIQIVEVSGVLKLYAKGKTLGWKSIDLT